MAASFHGAPALIHGAPALIHGADEGTAYKNVFVERKITFTLHKLFCYP